MVNSAANTAYYTAHCWLFQRRIEDARVYNVRVCTQGVRERLGGYGGLSVDVLWSWLHGRDGGCTTPLRLQVLLVLLRQVQHVHQEGRRLSLPMNAARRPPSSEYRRIVANSLTRPPSVS